MSDYEPEVPDEPVHLSAGGWCVPSDQIYQIYVEPPLWQEPEDGLLYWIPLETPTPLFDKMAMRHNGLVLGKRRGRNPADEKPLEITVRRGGTLFEPPLWDVYPKESS